MNEDIICPYCKKNIGYEEIYDDWIEADNELFYHYCEHCSKEFFVKTYVNVSFSVEKYDI